MPLEQIGKRIAAIRRNRGLSQASLAAKIGRSKSVINHIEHGHTDLSYDMTTQLAFALQCARHDLFALPDAPLPRIKFQIRRPQTKKAEPKAEAAPTAGPFPPGEKEATGLIWSLSLRSAPLGAGLVKLPHHGKG